MRRACLHGALCIARLSQPAVWQSAVDEVEKQQTHAAHTKDFPMNIERWFSGLLALTAIGLLTLAWGYTAPIAYDPIGPRPYPMLILSLLALGCIYLVVRPSTLTHALNLGYTKAILKNIGLCMAFLLAYALTFELLGFPLATALMAFGVGKLFGGSSKACLISGIALGALLYVLFDLLLDVPLPLGFFG